MVLSCKTTNKKKGSNIKINKKQNLCDCLVQRCLSLSKTNSKVTVRSLQLIKAQGKVGVCSLRLQGKVGVCSLRLQGKVGVCSLRLQGKVGVCSLQLSELVLNQTNCHVQGPL